MPNSSGTFKTGERVLESGRYQCMNCALKGTSTIITLESDKLFPYCAACDIKDNTYKRLAGKK